MAQPAGKGEEPTGLYGAADAVKVIGISPSSLYDWVEQGIIRTYTPYARKRRYYFKQDVDAMAEDQRKVRALLQTHTPMGRPKKKIA